MSDATVEAAQTIGWETNLVDGNFNAANAYATGIRQAIAGGADGVILVSIDCDLVKQPLAEAQTAGIEVVIANALGCEGEDLATLVVPSEENPTLQDWARAWGAAKADWIVAQTEGEANVLLFVLDDSLQTVSHDEGFQDEMEKCGACKIEVVHTSLADLGPPLEQLVGSALLSNPEANAIVFPYDSMITLGAGPAITRIRARSSCHGWRGV